ncbi:hypothetical protein VNO77_42534 [Canavalia gladiata]|uniref:Uncharacterized protein n=1 Tax=Canavalia gladiata TaxID=3824 RepID=A0AAN9JUP4_CANGL
MRILPLHVPFIHHCSINSIFYTGVENLSGKQRKMYKELGMLNALDGREILFESKTNNSFLRSFFIDV